MSGSAGFLLQHKMNEKWLAANGRYNKKSAAQVKHHFAADFFLSAVMNYLLTRISISGVYYIIRAVGLFCPLWERRNSMTAKHGLCLLALLLLAAGLWHGDGLLVMRKASMICLECIGIG